MKLLLDTHVVIWSQLEVHRLGKKMTRLLQSAETELFVSAITMLEIGQLIERRRMVLNGNGSALEWFTRATDGLGATVFPVNAQIAARAYSFSKPIHGDPADRVMAATAFEEHLILATADERLLEFALIKSVNAST